MVVVPLVLLHLVSDGLFLLLVVAMVMVVVGPLVLFHPVLVGLLHLLLLLLGVVGVLLALTGPALYLSLLPAPSISYRLCTFSCHGLP